MLTIVDAGGSGIRELTREAFDWLPAMQPNDSNLDKGGGSVPEGFVANEP